MKINFDRFSFNCFVDFVNWVHGIHVHRVGHMDSFVNWVEEGCKKDKNYYNWLSTLETANDDFTKPSKLTEVSNTFFQERRRKKGGHARLDKKIAKENLLIFKKIADKNGLKFWLIGGTLLGAVREKDFIDYDTDTDINIYFEDIPILINCILELMESGLNLLRVKEVVISFAKDDEYIDINFLHKPTKYTKQLDKIIFLDEEFNIPAYVDEYLTIVYGTWRTPCRKHSWIVPGI